MYVQTLEESGLFCLEITIRLTVFHRSCGGCSDTRTHQPDDVGLSPLLEGLKDDVADSVAPRGGGVGRFTRKSFHELHVYPLVGGPFLRSLGSALLRRSRSSRSSRPSRLDLLHPRLALPGCRVPGCHPHLAPLGIPKGDPAFPLAPSDLPSPVAFSPSSPSPTDACAQSPAKPGVVPPHPCAPPHLLRMPAGADETISSNTQRRTTTSSYHWFSHGSHTVHQIRCVNEHSNSSLPWPD